MAKRRYGFDEDKIQRYIKEGRGQGEESTYKPWLDVHDFPSKGNVSRCKGLKTRRVHHFMSSNETRFFYLLEWIDKIVDIREQFPLLDREDAMKMAEIKGIRYPVDIESRVPLILTTDFLITLYENGRRYDIARTIKSSTELDKPRVLEKYEIEKCYWEKRGIDWGIVTEREIHAELAQNVEWVHSAYNLEELDDVDKASLKRLIPILKNRLLSSEDTVQVILDGMDFEFNMKPGMFLYLFRHLIASKQIMLSNFQQKINISKITRDSILLP